MSERNRLLSPQEWAWIEPALKGTDKTRETHARLIFDIMPEFRASLKRLEGATAMDVVSAVAFLQSTIATDTVLTLKSGVSHFPATEIADLLFNRARKGTHTTLRMIENGEADMWNPDLPDDFREMMRNPPKGGAR